jgi:hypothetical protein
VSFQVVVVSESASAKTWLYHLQHQQCGCVLHCDLHHLIHHHGLFSASQNINRTDFLYGYEVLLAASGAFLRSRQPFQTYYNSLVAAHKLRLIGACAGSHAQ